MRLDRSHVQRWIDEACCVGPDHSQTLIGLHKSWLLWNVRVLKNCHVPGPVWLRRELVESGYQARKIKGLLQVAGVQSRD